MKLRGKLNKIKDKSNDKSIKLMNRMSEVRRRYRNEIINTVNNYYSRLHEIENELDFWKLYSKCKQKKSEPIVLFEGNKSKTKEENDEMLQQQFIKNDEKYEIVNMHSN